MCVDGVIWIVYLVLIVFHCAPGTDTERTAVADWVHDTLFALPAVKDAGDMYISHDWSHLGVTVECSICGAPSQISRNCGVT